MKNQKSYTRREANRSEHFCNAILTTIVKFGDKYTQAHSYSGTFVREQSIIVEQSSWSEFGVNLVNFADNRRK